MPGASTTRWTGSRCPPTVQRLRAKPGCLWCWWCTRFLACTNTLPTYAVAWPGGLHGHCPELYARQGDATQYGEIAKLMAELVARCPMPRSWPIWTVRWPGPAAWRRHGACRHHRLLLGRAHHVAVCCAWPGEGGWAWYGRLVGNATALTPKHPVDIATQLKAPVRGLYGGQDGGIP